MKRAKLRAIVYRVSCPYCEADYEGPSGAYHWYPEDLEGDEVACEDCGQSGRVPEWLPKTVKAAYH